MEREWTMKKAFGRRWRRPCRARRSPWSGPGPGTWATSPSPASGRPRPWARTRPGGQGPGREGAPRRRRTGGRRALPQPQAAAPPCRARLMLEALLGAGPTAAPPPHGETVIVEYSSPEYRQTIHNRALAFDHDRPLPGPGEPLPGLRRDPPQPPGRLGHPVRHPAGGLQALGRAGQPGAGAGLPLGRGDPGEAALPALPAVPALRALPRRRGGRTRPCATRPGPGSGAWRRAIPRPGACGPGSGRSASARPSTASTTRLGVGFDHLEMGEAFYQDQLAAHPGALQDAGLLKEGEGGARIIDLEDVGIPTPCLVQKGDGGSIYATRDMAAALYRAGHLPLRPLHLRGGRRPDPALQADLRGDGEAGPLVQGPHAPHPLRHGQPARGQDVHPQGQRDLPGGRAGRGGHAGHGHHRREEPGPARQGRGGRDAGPGRGGVLQRPQRPGQAHHLHLGPGHRPGRRHRALRAVRPRPHPVGAAQGRRRLGGPGPARGRPSPGLGRGALPAGRRCRTDLDGLEDAPAQALLFELAGLPDACAPCSGRTWAPPWRGSCWPSPRAFSGFYTNCPILWAENPAEVRDARLALCVATARALRQGLYLLGIQAPEEM